MARVSRRKLAALDALSRMRGSEGWSLTRAAKSVGLTRRQVLAEVGRAIYKQPNGRYRAKPWDRMSRPMRIPTPTGAEVAEVRDSRTAAKVSAYWRAADRYLKDGDSSGLREFEGVSFQSRGRTHEFLTDLDQLKRLTFVGEMRFEDIYDLTRGAGS